MQDNNKDQCSEKDETDKSWQTPGIVLRKARRDRDLDESDVCKELGLSIGSLKALEGDDFERLPAEIYVAWVHSQLLHIVGNRGAAGFGVLPEILPAVAAK